MENSFEEQMRIEKIRKKVKSIKGFYKHLIVYLLVNAFLLVTKWLSLDPGEAFWTFNTFSTAFFWGLGLLFHAFGVFGTDVFLGSEWEDRKIKEMMERNKQETTKWE